MITWGPLRGLPIFVTTRRLDVSCRETAPGYLITHFSARSVVTGSYGKIVSTCDRLTTTDTDTGPPYGRTASVLVAPALQASARNLHPGADTAAGRCFNHPVRTIHQKKCP